MVSQQEPASRDVALRAQPLTQPKMRTPSEVAALAAWCAVCNAPPGEDCYTVAWNGNTPRLLKRDFHPRRLKDALRTADLRKFKNEFNHAFRG